MPGEAEARRGRMLPQVDGAHNASFNSDRELLYKILFDMRNDVTDLKRLVLSMLNGGGQGLTPEAMKIVHKLDPADGEDGGAEAEGADELRQLERLDHISPASLQKEVVDIMPVKVADQAEAQEAAANAEPEICTLAESEKALIKRALAKFKNNRRKVARELQISERTLYRKIHDYGIED